MANYTGSECIICKEKFKEDDDIVVCPDCGTPYHRKCYKDEGKCINVKLHENNESWSKYTEKVNSVSDSGVFQKCKFCGTENQPQSKICTHCGASLSEGFNADDNAYKENSENTKKINIDGFEFDPQDKYCGMNPDEILENDVSVSDAADFVGSNAQYYLLLFKRMKETGKKITINIICILFPQFYFANRKMWLESIVTILLTSILSIPSMMYTLSIMDESLNIANMFDLQGSSFGLITRIASYASMAIRVLTCIFANWLYYKHVIRKIHSIKIQFVGNETEVKEKLKKSGGTSFLYILIAFAAEMIITAFMTWFIVNI